MRDRTRHAATADKQDRRKGKERENFSSDWIGAFTTLSYEGICMRADMGSTGVSHKEPTAAAPTIRFNLPQWPAGACLSALC